MYYTAMMHLNPQIREIHHCCGIKTPSGIDEWFVVLSDSDHRLLGTAGVLDGLIQGVAIHPDYQGKDLTSKLFESIFLWAYKENQRSLYLYTKPELANQFESLGFRRLIEVRPYAYLLEWGERQFDQFVTTLGLASIAKKSSSVGAVVVNCNPFTLGHQYLIEHAASRCEWVYILVVQEDKSTFLFKDRWEMIQLGTMHLDNVVMIPGDRFVVSALTFPSYFTRDEDLASAEALMDVTLFRDYIVPALGITHRFVGTEPFSPVTDLYNATMERVLVPAGVQVEIVPRVEKNHLPVSASRVRRLIVEDQWDELSLWVPQTTIAYLRTRFNEEPAVNSTENFKAHFWRKGVGYLEDEKTPIKSNLHSSSCCPTLEDVLAARERKATRQNEYLRRFGLTVISISLNIPGKTKFSSDWNAIIQSAWTEMDKALKAVKSEVIEVQWYYERTGAYVIVVANLEADLCKLIGIAIEERYPYRRLIDFDVYRADGNPITRKELGIEERKCFLCEQPAKLCMRERKHSNEAVMTQTQRWLREAIQESRQD